MIRIGCRAHDYGKHTPAQLAHILHTAGYTPTTMERSGQAIMATILA